MTDQWSVIESRTEYENPHFSVIRDLVETPDGQTNAYYRADFGDGGVIALGVESGDVIFVELYRPRLGRRMVELPGGGIESGETAEEAAIREFAEETGLRPHDARHLESLHFSAWSRTTRDVVWVEDFEEVTTAAEPEVRRVERVPVERAFDVACRNPVAEWNVASLCLARREGLIDF